MKISELIHELSKFPADTEVLVTGFSHPELDWSTISDFKYDGKGLWRDESTSRRVLQIVAGESIQRKVTTGRYANSQPHFIIYDSDGITRSA